jgi:hypothetical protein
MYCPRERAGLDTSQLGMFDETLLVEHPLPPLHEPGVSGTENGVNKHSDATDRIARPRVLRKSALTRCRHRIDR